jgi:glycosyltransferase involved in cell wall biosynthesis
VVGFVGNLAPWQGVEVLIRAFARLQVRDPLLVIVGGGQARAALEVTAKELGVAGRVRFVGTVPYHEVPAYVAACDVCTAPMSRERLKSGSSAIKVYEYLACERPVVASRIPGLEFVESEDLGRLVPPEDVQALSAALVAALEDEVWRQEAGRRGRAYVLRHAGWPAVAAAVEDVCRRAVGA